MTAPRPRATLLVVMRFFVLLVAVCVPTLGQADGLAAAGRIEADAGQSCSAVLIAPDLIATAAHCAKGFTGRQQEVFFRTGAYPGQPATRTALVSGTWHPLYDLPVTPVQRLRFDIALYRLVEALDGIAPIPPGPSPEEGDDLILASWVDGTAQRPRERMCPVIRGLSGLVTVGCPVRGGESGAPLIARTPDGLSLVAILTSRLQRGDVPIGQGTAVEGRIAPTLSALNLLPE